MNYHEIYVLTPEVLLSFFILTFFVNFDISSISLTNKASFPTDLFLFSTDLLGSSFRSFSPFDCSSSPSKLIYSHNCAKLSSRYLSQHIAYNLMMFPLSLMVVLVGGGAPVNLECI